MAMRFAPGKQLNPSLIVYPQMPVQSQNRTMGQKVGLGLNPGKWVL